MPTVGDLAPDFSGETSTGERVTLTALRGRPVVLYFYPRASSYGCTRESIGIAEIYPSLRARGVEVVGVSIDSRESQRRFRSECRLPFELVADADGSIVRSYGVLGMFGVARRVTFFLDADGRIVDRFDSLLPAGHLAKIRERFLSAPGPGAAGEAARRPGEGM